MYANSYPMNWGLINGPVAPLIILDFDHPAGNALKITRGYADVGLVPLAAIPTLKDVTIIGDYCIGARSRVRTVMLMSNSPMESISTIYLDHRSVTSVNLVKILSRYSWKRKFIWVNPPADFDYGSISPREGIVIIGDQCFEMENRFNYRYDLAEEWNNMTGLPFVFACWVSAGDCDENFRILFNQSLRMGVENIEKAAMEMNKLSYPGIDELTEYLKFNIDYPLDEQKRKAISLFMDYLKQINH